MEQVGSQVRLPFRRAFQIAVQGIRIRLGRSLVTVSGVVLGIAFLMSNVTAQLIKAAVANEREMRQTVSLMEGLVKTEVGSFQGKCLAVAVYGNVRPEEKGLLERLVAGGAAEIRALGTRGQGLTIASAETLGNGAGLMLILGDGASGAPLDTLTGGMTQMVVLDSLADRAFPGGVPAEVRRELFFGETAAEHADEIKEEAAQAAFRTGWIVVISLLVTVIGVSNALLMSVTERFREIGTMKCLGALSGFIRRLFLIESSLIGFAGSLLGVVLGSVLSIVAYGFTYQFAVVLGSVSYGWLLAAAAGSVLAGTLLAVVAAIYPATFASRMVPASALRSTV